VYDDLWRFDIATRHWHEVQIEGARPSQRSGHSCATVPDGFVIAGGWDGCSTLNEVWMLDLSGDVPAWHAIPPGIPANACFGMGVIDSTILSFGGLRNGYTPVKTVTAGDGQLHTVKIDLQYRQAYSARMPMTLGALPEARAFLNAFTLGSSALLVAMGGGGTDTDSPNLNQLSVCIVQQWSPASECSRNFPNEMRSKVLVWMLLQLSNECILLPSEVSLSILQRLSNFEVAAQEKEFIEAPYDDPSLASESTGSEMSADEVTGSSDEFEDEFIEGNLEDLDVNDHQGIE